MYTIIWQSKFKKDFKIATKRKKELGKLALIIDALQHNKPLPP